MAAWEPVEHFEVPALAENEALELVRAGMLEVLGRMPWSSNQTFLARIEHAGVASLAIYKPRRGERPLWDFPKGTLCRREVAAFELSRSLGWSIVPATVLRDGPLGVGSVQIFVDHDPEEHYFTLRDVHLDRFRQFALFDVVANNADRKAGHCLRGRDGHVWGIDHGVTFHAALKLRTVIWDFEGEPIGDGPMGGLEALDIAFREGLGAELAELLSPVEAEAAAGRLSWLLAQRVFPPPLTDYPYPWPMV